MGLNDINRQMKKKQLTEQLLKSAFVDLILENDGADAITVSEISDRADFNRGTFYIHYQNKSDLLEALYEDALDDYGGMDMQTCWKYGKKVKDRFK